MVSNASTIHKKVLMDNCFGVGRCICIEQSEEVINI